MEATLYTLGAMATYVSFSKSGWSSPEFVAYSIVSAVLSRVYSTKIAMGLGVLDLLPTIPEFRSSLAHIPLVYTMWAMVWCFGFDPEYRGVFAPIKMGLHMLLATLALKRITNLAPVLYRFRSLLLPKRSDPPAAVGFDPTLRTFHHSFKFDPKIENLYIISGCVGDNIEHSSEDITRRWVDTFGPNCGVPLGAEIWKIDFVAKYSSIRFEFMNSDGDFTPADIKKGDPIVLG